LAGETDRISWLVGGFYSSETIVENQGLGLGEDFARNLDANLAFLAPQLPALAGIELATGDTFGDVLDADSAAIAFAGGVDPNGSYAQNIFRQEGSSWSVFTHNSFHLTDKLDLVLGLRWTDEKKDGSFAQREATNEACANAIANQSALNSGAAEASLNLTTAGTFGAIHRGYTCFPFAVPADTGSPGTPNSFSESFADEELVYTGKAVYPFADRISGYISFTHGFIAGGFNLDATAAADNGDPSFDSETIDSWELGLKTDLFDRRLRLNLSLFDYDIKDFQVLEFTGIRFATFNVPQAQSRGFEVEALAMPTEGLQLMLNYTYADSKYPDDCDGGGDNAPAQVSSLCGAQFTNAPENVLTGGVSYDGYFNDGLHWFINTNGRWEDDRRTSTQPNLDFDMQESNLKLNARVGIASESRQWTVELWGNNVTDERTKNVTFNTPLRAGSRGTFLEAPRTYGLTLRTEF
jgi:outer membrane receptor protein involved in Fe transport